MPQSRKLKSFRKKIAAIHRLLVCALSTCSIFEVARSVRGNGTDTVAIEQIRVLRGGGPCMSVHGHIQRGPDAVQLTATSATFH